MTEKTILFINVFRHQIFQILVYCLCKNCNPPLKKSTRFSQQNPRENGGPSCQVPPFLRFGRRFNTLFPEAERGGGTVHTMKCIKE